ncbi:CCAAT-binding factor subunit A (HAP3) protein [Dioscorea alata]|uniref:CCAAT-binding factor subunit A (HAP3) protein n=1 Tax=Dioscorea alata TaxID=55571 RepID=A0ACB7VTQ2_DIOAL|nr:CCAAT-binding factor subunit A (HAP3) protein [Dioscorea alata]
MAEAPGSPGGSGGEGSPRSGVREQDRYLPIANISRIMKKALPANGKIAKDAKETVQEASDKCQKEKRKTINGDDLLWAMATLGFEDYIEPLKLYLQKYREMEGDSKATAKGGDGSLSKDGGGIQVGTPGTSTQGIAPQGSFTQGMNYIHTQFHNGDLSG